MGRFLAVFGAPVLFGVFAVSCSPVAAEGLSSVEESPYNARRVPFEKMSYRERMVYQFGEECDAFAMRLLGSVSLDACLSSDELVGSVQKFCREEAERRFVAMYTP